MLPLPAAQITACTFGGPQLDQLYVTTSREGLDADVRAEQPRAGAQFTVDVPGARAAGDGVLRLRSPHRSPAEMGTPRRPYQEVRSRFADEVTFDYSNGAGHHMSII